MFSKYNYVYQVYKESSFTKAAEKLYISQPSLSAAIKGIEQKIGAALFERKGSGVTLTEVGEAYITAAERMISAETEFTNKVSDIYNLETGHITVGGTNYLSSCILPEIINQFTMLHPKIKVNLIEANSGNLNDMVNNEQVDIIIDSFDETMIEYEGTPLVNEKILLCVPKDNKINDKFKEYQILPDSIYEGTVNLETVKTVPMSIFKNEKFILLKKGNDMYNRAMNILTNSGIDPDVIFSVDQLNISHALTEAGMGLCFITDTFFKYRKFRKNVVLYNVSQEHSSRTLYIAYKKNKYCTKVMTEFIKISSEIIHQKNI